ncbi:hypothetical protein A2U01_0062449, partial [Trifolium medium]|nr:hypothetical protein [Trifolium medium]
CVSKELWRFTMEPWRFNLELYPELWNNLRLCNGG